MWDIFCFCCYGIFDYVEGGNSALIYEENFFCNIERGIPGRNGYIVPI